MSNDTTHTARPRRSALFTPADDAEMLQKAVGTDADAFIFDLEDAVHPSRRETARENLREHVPNLDVNREVAVRVNGWGTEDFASDLETAVEAGADAVALPMVDSGRDIRETWRELTALTDDPPRLRATVETPTGMHAGTDIAAACRETGVESLGFGFADYCKAVGSPGTPDRIRKRLELLTVEYAAMGGVDPVASVHLDIGDEAGLRRVAERARETGFVGMTAIHPAQVSVINEAFTPPPDEVTQARRLVESFDASERDSLEVESVFLDTATVDRYRRLLERAPE
ncbi:MULTISPECIES: CoA ester lyase [Haloferax]|uniref:CoA ester lyase n=2 Tax=Haloferax TaxID=2251 RepID=A0A6G1Z4R3_9EURY|nr:MULTISPECIES: CoA ester lyase [Haloferax]KAB1188780.1 CoA ester lyase [Haloferax sp. CBA1149]MRW81493.1 CoA ester lyase [Haloferax marinisediminis]